MIQIENTQVVGLEAAIRGMRNPKNSWDKSDSGFGRFNNQDDHVGQADLKLMNQLASGGPVHAKYRRYIDVFVDINAPLYFWKEFKTYRKGKDFVDEENFYDYDGDHVIEDYIEMNSCSTMHKIHDRELTIDDFSCDHLGLDSIDMIKKVIELMNYYREQFIETKDKHAWWQLIQLLPSSYNQRRTVKLNYEVLAAMYHWRKGHKLDEWKAFCRWIESLPYSELITGIKKEEVPV
jgi:hypothetical protein